MKKTRYWVYLFVSLWKMLFFTCMVFFMFLRLDSVGDLFTKFTDSFNQHKIFVNEVSLSGLVLLGPYDLHSNIH